MTRQNPQPQEAASPVELVVLLDSTGRAVGEALKRDVHHADTPLHLAFSCYLFDASGRLLVTQRSAGKLTFPGVWTNSCCGHPAPGEDIFDAARRRIREELGIEVPELRLLLPAFRYRAVMPNGVVENEICPVFVATLRHAAVSPDPGDVQDHLWVPWLEFQASVLDGSRTVSPWCAKQVAALPQDPLNAPEAAHRALPLAAVRTGPRSC